MSDFGRTSDPLSQLRRALQPPPTDGQPAPVKLTRIRVLAPDVPALAESLRRWYEAQKLETTTANTAGGVMVQCRTRDAWRRAVGLGIALTVVLRAEGADLLVEVGPAKWLGKGLAGGASLLAASTPLAPVVWVTVGIGSWRQYRLPQQTIEFLQATAPTRAGTRSPASGPPSPVTHTPALALPAPVDVNLASAQQLAAVPGLDRASAELLVAQRARAGGYRSMTDVQRALAQRLQPHAFRNLRPRLTLSALAQPQPAGPAHPDQRIRDLPSAPSQQPPRADQERRILD